MWVNLSPEEASAIHELESLPDRAAGIVGATILEARLGDRLKRETEDLSIKEKSTLHKRMFDHSGPLGPFSARINLGFMLKIYDEQAWRDLDVIRSIRNDFAHQTEVGSFHHDSVRDRCQNLRTPDMHFVERTPETDWFISTAESDDPSVFLEMTFSVDSLDAKLADPRHRYLMCVQYYSAYLMFPFGLLTVHG